MKDSIESVLNENLLRFISNNSDGMEWALGIDGEGLFDRDKDYKYNHKSDEHIVKVDGKSYKIKLNIVEIEDIGELG